MTAPARLTVRASLRSLPHSPLLCSSALFLSPLQEANWASSIVYNILDCISDFRIYADNIDGVLFGMAHVVRRNTIAATGLQINFLRDGVIEQNSFTDALCAYAGSILPAGSISINQTSTGVVVANN